MKNFALLLLLICSTAQADTLESLAASNLHYSGTATKSAAQLTHRADLESQAKFHGWYDRWATTFQDLHRLETLTDNALLAAQQRLSQAQGFVNAQFFVLAQFAISEAEQWLNLAANTYLCEREAHLWRLDNRSQFEPPTKP